MAIATTRGTQHRTAVNARFLPCTIRVADVPSSSVYRITALSSRIMYIYGNRRIFYQLGRPFFSATSFGVVDQFIHLSSEKKKTEFF